MHDLETSRLVLHPVDLAEAQRIRDRVPAPADAWADDYPFEGDLAALTMLAAAWASEGEQRPFGYYRIDRRSDRHAIGGIGFKGRPAAAAVEIGYGLARSGRGHGYAAEAVAAIALLAAGHGVHRLLAEVEVDNLASVRTLQHAGFVQSAAESGLLHFELALG